MLLELKNICKSYKNGSEELQVLKHVSLSVEKGDYLAIMGPSGSGKSTLMNIIGCRRTDPAEEPVPQGAGLSGAAARQRRL